MSITEGEVSKESTGLEVEKSPAGPQWPKLWDFAIAAPEQVIVGDEVEVRLRVSPALFDVGQIRLTPFVSGQGLTAVDEGDVWTGAMKQGEPVEVVLRVRANQEGFAGQCGLNLQSESLYKDMAVYLASEESAPLGDARVRNELVARLHNKESASPLYRTRFITRVDAMKKEAE